MRTIDMAVPAALIFTGIIITAVAVGSMTRAAAGWLVLGVAVAVYGTALAVSKR